MQEAPKAPKKPNAELKPAGNKRKRDDTPRPKNPGDMEEVTRLKLLAKKLKTELEKAEQ